MLTTKKAFFVEKKQKKETMEQRIHMEDGKRKTVNW